ncbi:MAG: single-stranded DNA-binding protein, partial [Spirochaetales bacterium]|nr:single-stranded DNA-binding protein [Spirochaetales bacterium]
EQLSPGERDLLTHICDIHLKKVILILEPEYLVGIGKYAEKNLKRVAASLEKKDRYTITSILHPSPANPHANRGWADAVTQQLIEQGIWS